MTCDRCYQPVHDDTEHGLGLCPLEPRRAAVVWADDIPGGLTIHHGLCNADGSGRTYYSKSEIRLECEKRNLVPWSDVYEERRVKPWQEYAEHRDHSREQIEMRRDRRADRARRATR